MDNISSSQITKKEVEVLLSYQPKLMGLKAGREGENILYQPLIEEFLQMWDVTGFTVPFDYVEWAEKEKLKLEDTDAVIEFFASAENEKVRRLATAIVRMERFSDGYLNTLWSKGLAQVFFERLKDFA